MSDSCHDVINLKSFIFSHAEKRLGNINLGWLMWKIFKFATAVEGLSCRHNKLMEISYPWQWNISYHFYWAWYCLISISNLLKEWSYRKYFSRYHNMHFFLRITWLSITLFYDLVRVSCLFFNKIWRKIYWQRWDSNPRHFWLVPKTSALDRSATLPRWQKLQNKS